MAGYRDPQQILKELEQQLLGPRKVLGTSVFSPTPMSGNAWVQGWQPNSIDKTTQSNINSIKKNGGMLDSVGDFFGNIFRTIDDSSVGHAILSTLDAPRNAVFNQAESWFDGQLNWDDALGGLVKGAVNAYSRDPNDKTYFGDVAGAASDWLGSGNGNTYRSMARDGNMDGGDILDILLDPINYLTIGAGSTAKAAKAGTKLGQAEAVAKGFDLSSNEAKSLIDQSINASVAKSNNQLLGLNVPFGPEFNLIPKFGPLRRESQLIGDVPASDLSKMMQDFGLTNEQGIKLAGNMFNKDLAENALKGLNTQEYDFITNQLQGDFGRSLADELAKSNPIEDFLSSSAPKTYRQQDATTTLDNLLTSIKPQVDQLATPPLESPKLLDKWLEAHLPSVGINATRDEIAAMSYAEKADLAATLKPNIVGNVAETAAAKQGADLSQLLAGKVPTISEMGDRAHFARVAGVGKDLPKSIRQPATVKATPSVQNALNNVEDMFKTAGSGYKYHSGLDGMSKVGKLIGTSKAVEGAGKMLGSRRYVPMSSQLADHRLAGGVGDVLNARNKGFAYAMDQINKLTTIVKHDADIKALTKDELEMVPYIVEGKWPASVPQPTADRMDAITKAADKFKGYMQQLTTLERDAGLDYAMRENYFPHVMNTPQDANGMNDMLSALSRVRPDIAQRIRNSPAGFTKSRQAFETMADLKDALAEHANDADFTSMFGNAAFNPVEAYGKRAIKGAQSIARADMYTALHENGLLKDAVKVVDGKERHVEVPNGWKVVGKEIPQLEGKMMPDEVYKQITYADNLLHSDTELAKFLDKSEKVYTVWRRNVTVAKLGFHVRQVIGNVFQNSLAGVTAPAYAKAFDALVWHPEKHEKMLKEALENGVVHTGSSSADMLTSLEHELLGKTAKSGNMLKTAASNLNPLGEQFVLGRWGRKAGEFEDNLARYAHYVWARDKGMSPEMARDSVRKYLYNYSEINSVGRGLRVVLPFYQWMRNNLPFQIVNAAKNPTKYMAISDLLTAAQDEPSPDEAMDQLGINNPTDRELVRKVIEENGGVLPQYIRDKYVNVGGDNYFNVSVPSSDLSMLNHPLKELVNASSPYIKTPIELITNEKLVSGGPIDKYSDGSAGFTEGAKYTLEQLGGGPVQGILGLLTGDLDKLLKSTGIMPSNVDPAQELKNLIWDKKKELDMQRKKEKDQQGGK